MNILDTTLRKWEAVLGEATSSVALPVVAAVHDRDSTNLATLTQLSRLFSTAAVAVVPAPSSGSRVIVGLTLVNADTIAHNVQIRFNDNGTTYRIISSSLAPNDTLQFSPQDGFHVLDGFGQIKTVVATAALSATFADQALHADSADSANVAFSGTGSFTGTFIGDGSNLDGVVSALTSSFAFTASLALSVPKQDSASHADSSDTASFSTKAEAAPAHIPLLMGTFGSIAKLQVPTQIVEQDTGARTKWDFTPFTQARIVVRVEATGALSPSGVVAVQWSLDEQTWTCLSSIPPGAPSASMDVLGTFASPWCDITGSALQDVVLRWTTYSGSNATLQSDQPAISRINLQVR